MLLRLALRQSLGLGLKLGMRLRLGCGDAIMLGEEEHSAGAERRRET
jgi:hypothetical protein